MASVDLGKVGFLWRGEYDSTATYDIYDVVVDSKNKRLYLSLKSNNTGNPLTDTTNWALWIDGGGVMPDIIKSDNDPTITENLTKGTIWENTTTGELFCCVDDTNNNNVWQGQLGTVVAPTTANIVDIFGDGSEVALYQLDGNANDTGGLYNGTEHNITYTEGKFGQAAVFNGSDSYIDLGNQMTDAYYSFSFWADFADPQDWERILDFGESDGSDWQVVIGIDGHETNTTLFYRNGKNNVTSQDGIIISNELHHYAVVQDSGNVKFYRDGNLIVTNSTSETPQAHSRSSSFIGKSNWSSDSYYKGKIDQIRIFNRTLTDDEVQQLYNEK